jgi:hypothetical protein
MSKAAGAISSDPARRLPITSRHEEEGEMLENSSNGQAGEAGR